MQTPKARHTGLDGNSKKKTTHMWTYSAIKLLGEGIEDDDKCKFIIEATISFGPFQV
jgi:hypothetical protein